MAVVDIIRRARTGPSPSGEKYCSSVFYTCRGVVGCVFGVSQRVNLQPLSVCYRSPVTREFPKFISRSFHKAFAVTENTNSAALEANHCGKLSLAMV